MGLKLTTLHFTMVNDDPERVFQLSERSGIAGTCCDHRKSRPVRYGHHFMIKCDPGQDLGLF